MINETLTPPGSRPPAVVLVGAAHIDRIAAADGPFRAGTSNPGSVTERFGGAAFNAALALRAFDVDVHLVSACGGDEVAERVGAAMAQADIDDGRIAWLDRLSATYTALVDATGELIGGVADMDIYDRLVPRALTRRHLRKRLEAAEGVLVDANLPAASLAHLAKRETACPLAAIAVSPAKAPRLGEALPLLSMLFASRAEAASLYGLSADATDADLSRAIMGSGLRRAVVTDGARPVLVVDHRAVWRQIPPPVEAVADVVGAGDTVAGAAFAAFLMRRPFDESVRIGLAAASLRIGPGLDPGSATTVEAIAHALPEPQAIPA